jgi:hypothetical protein
MLVATSRCASPQACRNRSIYVILRMDKRSFDMALSKIENGRMLRAILRRSSLK